MRTASFPGGLRLPSTPVDFQDFEVLPVPEKLIIPARQHHGEPATATVKKGQVVKKGQIVAESADTAMHATVSGKVSEIDKNFQHISGDVVPAVILESDGEESASYAYMEQLQSLGKLLRGGLLDFSRTSHPLLDRISRAQIVKTRTLIINGLDELFLQGTNATLLATKTAEVLEGVRILQQFTGAEQVSIAIYENLAALRSALQEHAPGYRIVPVKAKHPQHLDQPLVLALTGEEYPVEMNPEDLGIVTLRAETAYAAYRAVQHNEPFLEKYVTVSGSGLAKPRNLQARIGTPVRQILEFLGMDTESLGKVVVGGPLTGRALQNVDTPVTKETHQIYLQSKDDLVAFSSEVCVKCGLCVKVCPMRLMPFLLSGFSEGGYFDMAEKNDIFSCIECGCCAYVCPVKIPMVQWIQLGKTALRA
jgi:electron transport complex protein RnfC